VTAPLLTRRDAIVWTLAFLLVSTLLVAVQFTSDDPDSALYAALSARLASGPPARWIAPEWWGNWEHEGLFREHPAGVFLLPALLGWLGVPGIQAAYIVGIGAGVLSVVLTSVGIARVSSVANGRAALILLQLMPLAFIFRIRANHEYPMLACLLLAVIGIEGARRSWRWIWVTPLALCAAVLVKAAFVAVPLLAVGWWMVTNPLRTPASLARPVVALVLSAVAVLAMAMAYDAVYIGLTGESFWGGYYARQMAPLSMGVQPEGQPGVIHHAGFYGLRVLWHPAPWSLALIVGAWSSRRRWSAVWRSLPASHQRALVFSLGFAFTTVAMLTPASRFAERYIFSANYALAAAGIVVALHLWPALRSTLVTWDQRLPALPALCWTLLMVLRLIVGPLLPRISS
jgi:4-amino-4-deoxy-L-arabinose transferase-like glycosyltransferase